MNIHVVVCARNEADIIETFVRYAMKWSTKVHLVLHRCLDNSVEVARRLRDDGAPLELSLNANLLHEHGTVMTGLAHRAADEGAEWVFALDVDEFGVGDVRHLGEGAEASEPIELPWRGYVPLPTDVSSEPNILRRVLHRRKSECPEWFKVAIPGRLLRNDPLLTLSYGCHQLFDGLGRLVPGRRCGLQLAHFPVRSRRQLMCKVFGGWLSNVADPSRPKGNTFQWKAVFDAAKQGKRFTSGRLRDIALDYATHRQWNRLAVSFRGSRLYEPEATTCERGVVFDPVLCDFQLTVPVRAADPMDVLLDTSEAFAQRYGDLLVEIALLEQRVNASNGVPSAPISGMRVR
jgi:hypothetical protein